MAGNTNFPTALDDDTSLIDVTDAVTSLQAAHHNNLKEAMKAIQSKVGIHLTNAPTSLDYRLGNATAGHRHDGASGHGPKINATTIVGLQASVIRRFTERIHLNGSMTIGSNLAAPVRIGRTAQIENVSAALRRGPSGATTTSVLVRVGPTHIFGASVGLGVRFPSAATAYGQPSPNLSTYPSGAMITLDVESVGESAPGQDLSVIFVFRE